MNKSFFTFFTVLIVLFSCNHLPDDVQRVLELAGSNSKELQAVLNHYQEPKDSLKLRAAYFLIGNMDTKFSYDHNKIGGHSKLIHILDSLNVKMPYSKYDDVKHIWDSLNTKYGYLNVHSLPIIRDVDVITSDFLIDNIDLAFEVWENKPWAKHITFDQFCEFILPYRSTQEPLESWRNLLKTKYSWLSDSLKNKAIPPLEVCSRINDSIKWFTFNQVFYEYPDLKFSDLPKTRWGKCVDMSNFANFTMRANGIPVASVYTPFGTSWNTVIDTDGQEVDFLGTNQNPVKGKTYRHEEKMAKVFRITYANKNELYTFLKPHEIPNALRSPNIIDVTQHHIESSDVIVTLNESLPLNIKYLFLCVYYHKSKSWEAIHWGRPESNKQVRFTNMGHERVYLPMYYNEGQYFSVGSPFYLSNKGEKVDLTANSFLTENITLRRKYPLNVHEISKAKQMIGAKFQGSNSLDFKNAIDLFTIKEAPEYAKEVKIKNSKKFRYIRLNYKKERYMSLAELSFFEYEKDYPLKGDVLWECIRPLSKEDVMKAFDNDIRTNVDSQRDINLTFSNWIGLDLEKPIQIGKVKYLPGNSFNTIEPNDTYELFYWDAKWVSLGIKKAEEDYLLYDNVPKNALLILRNHTQGIEEMVFFMKDGKQIWG